MPSNDDLRAAEPLSRRAAGAPDATPEDQPVPVAGTWIPALPPDAPPWKRHAYDLAYTLSRLVADPASPPSHVVAAMERAYEAWYAGGATSKDIARVARLVERAHEAIRATPAQQSQAAYVLCGEVLLRGLPRNYRARATVSQAVHIVMDLQREPIASIARRQGTMSLLGWQDASNRWAESLIQMSLAVVPER